MKRYIPFEVNFDFKVIGDKETIRVQAVMLEDPEGPYVNFSDVERLIAERDAARQVAEETTQAALDTIASHVQAIRQRDAAVKALRQYGHHLSMCKSNILLTSMPPQRQPCDCGLNAAIDAARGKA